LGWNGIPFYFTDCKTHTRGWNDAGMVITRVIRVILVIRVVFVGWKVPLIRKVGTTLLS
jgi:hypothetical protein